MAKPRGKRAVARGISRGRLTLDACSVDLAKIRRLPENALSKVWARIHHRARRGDHALHALANYAINLAAAKSSARMYTGQHRRHAVHVYMHAAKLAKDKIAQACAARTAKALRY